MVGFVAVVVSVAMVMGVSVVQHATGVPLVWPFVIATAAWAAWDSTKVRVRDYKTGMALHPFGVFIGVALLWIVGFPWYLAVRYRIKNGKQERKAVEVAAPVATPT